MRIVDYFSDVVVQSEQEVEKALTRRYGNDANEFLLCPEAAPYPNLTILVKGNMANLFYAPNDHDPGFVSTGHTEGLERDGFTTFYINTPTETHEVPNYTIVDFSSALQAATQFLQAAGLPSAVKWYEL